MKRHIALIALAMLLAALAEFSMGRRVWGVGGIPGLWSGNVKSAHNSQYLLDPYTFTHISPGVLLYGILSIALKSTPVPMRLAIAVGLEAAWEVLENTDTVIEHYRTETISLSYYGDSIVNSMGDILACMLGFVMASRLPKRVTIAGVVVLELILAVWIRDNLAINIVMLLNPSAAIRAWQLR
jgi:hypothetical protein